MLGLTTHHHIGQGRFVGGGHGDKNGWEQVTVCAQEQEHTAGVGRSEGAVEHAGVNRQSVYSSLEGKLTSLLLLGQTPSGHPPRRPAIH